jgi:methylmalonyl-CoA/ethylmalonyl-CoA epimerase
MKGYVKKINHIAVVVDDIEKALEFWHDALGLDLSHVEDVPSENSMVAFLPAQESEVELVKPTNEDSGIARFLKSRGPGLHHICFEVYDIEETMAHLKSKDVRLINQTPEIGTGGKKIAFVHPDSTHGVLVELYQLTSDESAIRLARARLLADRVLTEGQSMAAAAMDFLRNLRNNRQTK